MTDNRRRPSHDFQNKTPPEEIRSLVTRRALRTIAELKIKAPQPQPQPQPQQ